MSAAPPVSPLPRLMLEPLVRMALLEDLGRAGDVTTAATIPPGARALAHLVARAPGCIAGLACAEIAFALLDPAILMTRMVEDGAMVGAGTVLARIEGPAAPMLTAERVALNFLQHLSGIATATRAHAAAIAHTRARIVCTRKTTPGLRAVEKYAVRAGGGLNHRFGLDDGLLIKDNHILAAGGIARAVERARAAAGHMLRLEVEVETLDELAEALAAGADAVLLDNMPPERLRAAVARAQGTALTEASGGVTLASIAAIAETGVDIISSGALTHSAPALDLALDFQR